MKSEIVIFEVQFVTYITLFLRFDLILAACHNKINKNLSQTTPTKFIHLKTRRWRDRNTPKS